MGIFIVYRKIILLIVLLNMAACASAPGISYVTKSTLSTNNTYKHIFKMAKKCFSRKPTPFRDGKLVKLGTLPNGEKIITLHHYAFDLGVLEPELRIVISKDGKQVSVDSDEISDQTEALVLDRMANIKRIKLWATGSSECARK
jgi:hypothetical protein